MLDSELPSGQTIGRIAHGAPAGAASPAKFALSFCQSLMTDFRSIPPNRVGLSPTNRARPHKSLVPRVARPSCFSSIRLPRSHILNRVLLSMPLTPRRRCLTSYHLTWFIDSGGSTA